MDEIKKNEPAAQGYYIDKNRKTADFYIGVFGPAAASYVMYLVVSLIYQFFTYVTGREYGAYYNYILIVDLLIFCVNTAALAVWAVRAKRKFVLRGIAIAYLVPLAVVAILWGWCFLSIKTR